MNAFANFDTGGGGSEGPWLSWSARGTLDGAIAAKSFILRDTNGKTLFEGFARGGVVLDIDTMKTGWCYSDGAQGQAPDWKMNPTLDRFIQDPSTGDRSYKRGFKIRCAIGDGKTAAWDQAGASVWTSFTGLIPALQQQPAPGMLPLVKLTGTKLQQFKRGSTVEPILEVVKWVAKPDCLKEGAAAGIAVDPAPAAAPQPAPAAAPVPADAEF